MIIEQMTTVDFSKGLKKTRTVIVPMGSIEEHGPHLPMNTDILHAYEIAKKAADKVPVFVAPPINFGVCRSTADFPGTVAVRSTTLVAVVLDVVDSLYRHGIKNFILYSGHAGMNHVAAILDAADQIMNKYDDTRFSVITDLELTDAEFFKLVETPADSHAGEIETSLIMSLAPELVGEPAEPDFPKFPKPFLVRDTQEYWKTGVWGDPKRAGREKGDKMVEILVRNLVRLVEEIGG
ncbi:MAG: creatininase family protein [Deltaproteobacteria bacterium]|uniref:Creatininase family protein n=1 Tax=Candidatus Zymogenus saltonus TaxID=2844893 RepID=A0A9D8KFR0_9DELT|nr:creatininase family protein [Candidatus Zymogenus saltonus]